MKLFGFGKKKDQMTIYERLLGLGYSHEQMVEAQAKYSSPRRFSLVMSIPEDETPIVGISYTCDYRAEEEWGIGDLQKSFGLKDHDYTMTHVGRDHWATFEGIPSLILSTKWGLEPVATWGHDIDRKNGDVALHGSKDTDGQRWGSYDLFFESDLAYAQEFERLDEWKTMDEIKAAAKEAGITGPFPRKKADLLSMVRSHPLYVAQAKSPNVWPGWFNDGKTLVLRADRGIVADTLKMLAEAAENETLSFGGGSQVFGSGLSLYDGMDVGPKLEAERKAQAKWYDAEMAKLKPVEEALKAKGYRWYFLGSPKNGFKSLAGNKVADPEETYYWLNGSGQPQPFGWYTREELLAEKFVADALEKHK